MNTTSAQERANSPPLSLPHPVRVNTGEASEQANGPSGTILSVSPLEEDHACLRRVGKTARWKTREAYSYEEASVAIAEEHPDVVLCEVSLPDGNWRELLAELSRGFNPPYLIVASRLADDYLWAEALNLGAYDVLAKPFDPIEIYRVVGFACQRHRDQHNGRTMR